MDPDHSARHVVRRLAEPKKRPHQPVKRRPSDRRAKGGSPRFAAAPKSRRTSWVLCCSRRALAGTCRSARGPCGKIQPSNPDPGICPISAAGPTFAGQRTAATCSDVLEIPSAFLSADRFTQHSDTLGIVDGEAVELLAAMRLCGSVACNGGVTDRGQTERGCQRRVPMPSMEPAGGLMKNCSTSGEPSLESPG